MTRRASTGRLLSLAGLMLVACAFDALAPPTPTKTPGPTATPEVVFPAVEALAEVVLGQADVDASYSADPDNTGPLTVDLLADASSQETAAFLRAQADVYGYRSAFLRTTNVDQLAAIRNWVVVLGSVQAAHDFVGLHPTITQGEAGFEFIPFPALGDESVAFFATTSQAGVVPLDRHDVVIRRRNVVGMVFVVTASGLAEMGEIEGYARTLDARLSEIGNP